MSARQSSEAGRHELQNNGPDAMGASSPPVSPRAWRATAAQPHLHGAGDLAGSILRHARQADGERVPCLMVWNPTGSMRMPPSIEYGSCVRIRWAFKQPSGALLQRRAPGRVSSRNDAVTEGNPAQARRANRGRAPAVDPLPVHSQARIGRKIRSRALPGPSVRCQSLAGRRPGAGRQDMASVPRTS